MISVSDSYNYTVQVITNSIADTKLKTLAIIGVEFFLARKPKQAFGTVILPLMVIGLLAVFGALIPYSTGEKYGYLITVFLALIFYLDLMSSEISPAGDKDLPLILYVLYATAASLTYSLMETIFLGKK